MTHHLSLPALAAALILIAMLAMAGCKSNKIFLPAINAGAANIELQGKFVWFDLHSTDMTAASNFYDKLFGWDFTRTNDLYPHVKTIHHRGQAIGSLFGREPETGRSEWISVMSVPDTDVMVELVEELGGKVETPAKDMPNRGEQVTVLDNQGARITLLKSSSGDPVDGPYIYNGFMGSELWTTTPAKATHFYVQLGRYKTTTLDSQTAHPYVLLLTKDKPRATINDLLPKSDTPRWIPIVMVQKLLSVLTQVDKLGGKVILPPDPSFRQGTAAVIQDPSGAFITLQQSK